MTLHKSRPGAFLLVSTLAYFPGTRLVLASVRHEGATGATLTHFFDWTSCGCDQLFEVHEAEPEQPMDADCVHYVASIVGTPPVPVLPKPVSLRLQSIGRRDSALLSHGTRRSVYSGVLTYNDTYLHSTPVALKRTRCNLSARAGEKLGRQWSSGSCKEFRRHSQQELAFLAKYSRSEAALPRLFGWCTPQAARTDLYVAMELISHPIQWPWELAQICDSHADPVGTALNLAHSAASALALLLEEACVLPSDLVQKHLMQDLHEPYLRIKSQRYIRQFAIRLAEAEDVATWEKQADFMPDDGKTCSWPTAVFIDVDLSEPDEMVPRERATPSRSEVRENGAPLDHSSEGYRVALKCQTASLYSHILLLKVIRPMFLERLVGCAPVLWRAIQAIDALLSSVDADGWSWPVTVRPAKISCLRDWLLLLLKEHQVPVRDTGSGGCSISRNLKQSLSAVARANWRAFFSAREAVSHAKKTSARTATRPLRDLAEASVYSTQDKDVLKHLEHKHRDAEYLRDLLALSKEVVQGSNVSTSTIDAIIGERHGNSPSLDLFNC